jgi:CBS domain-containing protein
MGEAGMAAKRQAAADVPLVKDAMTPGIVTISPDMSLVVAARRMRDADVRCLPVVEAKRLIGMITEWDLVVRGLADEQHAGASTVREAMSLGPLFCFVDQTLEEARAIMEANRIKRLPVMDRRRRLVGILSRGDIDGRGPKCRPHQVTFYKKVITSAGQPRDVSVATVYLAPGIKREEVAAAAIRKFEQDRGVKPWNRLADAFEVAPGDEQAGQG